MPKIANYETARMTIIKDGRIWTSRGPFNPDKEEYTIVAFVKPNIYLNKTHIIFNIDPADPQYDPAMYYPYSRIVINSDKEIYICEGFIRDESSMTQVNDIKIGILGPKQDVKITLFNGNATEP